MKRSIKYLLLGVLASGAFSVSAWAGSPQSAVIDWGSGPHNITGDSDVITTGDLVTGSHLGPTGTVTDITINGVTFTGVGFPTSGTDTSVLVGNNNTLFLETAQGNFLVSYGSLGSGTGAFAGLSSNYQGLLSTAGGSSFVSTLQITLSGLVVGQEYVFQFFTNNSSLTTSSFSGTRLSTTATAGNSIAIVDNVSNTAGDLGQYGIGTFTATDVNQVINFDGGPNFQVPTINAFQLRAIPEPSSIAMMAVGMGGLGAVMRLRRSRS